MQRLLLILLLLTGSLLGIFHNAQTESIQATTFTASSNESGSSIRQALATRYLLSAEITGQRLLGSEELSDDLHDAESFALLSVLQSKLFATAGNDQAWSLLFTHYSIRAPPQV